MEWIKNQPVYFGTENECSNDEIPSQLVDQTDVSQVQFSINPCEDAEQLIEDPTFSESSSSEAIILNCDFENDDDDWFGFGDVIFASSHVEFGSVGGYGRIRQTVFVDYITTYSVEVDIASVTGAVNVFFGTGNQVATLTTVGTHVVTGLAVGDLILQVDVTAGDVAIVNSVCSVSVSSYWTLDEGWSILDNKMCFESETATSTATILEFETDKYYQVNISVASIGSGETISVYLGTTLIGAITTTGNYSFYGFPAGANAKLTLTPSNSGFVCVSEITAYEINTDFLAKVKNSEGVVLGNLSYYDDPSIFVLKKNTVTVNVDWSDLDLLDGCYSLEILNNCDTNALIRNDYFNPSKGGWIVADSDWTISLGSALGHFVNGYFLYQSGVFPDITKEYCVKINVVSISGSLNVWFGDSIVQTITTPGIHTVTGTPDTEDYIVLNLSSGDVEIEYVSTCAPNSFNSNVFKLGSYSNDCTLLINSCNNEDGLGFVFEGNNFTPRVRLEAKLRQAKYKSERTVYESSIGKKSNVYFSGRKSKNLCIDQQPEYIHDFLRLLLGFDNVYVNGVKYSVDDDEYNVEYSEESDNVGKVRILISEQAQNVKNINSTDTENDCTL